MKHWVYPPIVGQRQTVRHLSDAGHHFEWSHKSGQKFPNPGRFNPKVLGAKKHLVTIVHVEHTFGSILISIELLAFLCCIDVLGSPFPEKVHARHEVLGSN
jgi:hypothetical protein